MALPFLFLADGFLMYVTETGRRCIYLLVGHLSNICDQRSVEACRLSFGMDFLTMKRQTASMGGKNGDYDELNVHPITLSITL